MPDIPTAVPASVNAGDTIQWTRSISDYPASSGWALSYVLINAAGKISIAGSASGADFAVTVAAATSALWTPGTYDWREQVSKAGEVFTTGSGRITVAPSFTTNATLDNRSKARQDLEMIDARLGGSTLNLVAEYEIAGRRVKNYSIDELLVLRDRYAGMVAKEDAAANVAAGLPDRRRAYVRFG
jgi:hypothetical protein